MRFESQYRKPIRFNSNIGSRVKIKYAPVYDELGRLTLEEKGTEDFYEYIQSFAESVDIHVLLKRFANGEVDVLSRVQGFYGDMTEYPKNYAEMLNKVIEGENFFNGLPVEVRSQFGHSYTEFLASIGTQKFFDVFGVRDKESEEKVPSGEVELKKEVSEDE